MTSTNPASAPACGTCGALLTEGRCSWCASPQASAAPNQPGKRETEAAGQGWADVSTELLEGHPHGLAAVMISFLRHPVGTIIRLTDDADYRGHWGFLWTSLGLSLTLLHVVLPHLSAAVFGTPVRENRAAIVILEVMQYVGIALTVPVQYYLCRALGTRPRPPRAYLKFCVLSVSYCQLVVAVASLMAWGVAVAAVKFQIPVAIASIQLVALIATQLSLVTFVSMAHKRFWGMTWPRAIGVTVAIALASWLVVYPALGAVAEHLFPGKLAGHTAPAPR